MQIHASHSCRQGSDSLSGITLRVLQMISLISIERYNDSKHSPYSLHPVVTTVRRCALLSRNLRNLAQHELALLVPTHCWVPSLKPLRRSHRTIRSTDMDVCVTHKNAVSWVVTIECTEQFYQFLVLVSLI